MRDPVNYRHVTDEQGLHAVARFWAEQFSDTAPYLSTRDSEQVWLACSYVFAGFVGDRVAAACRLSPYHAALGWEAGSDLDAILLDRFDRRRCAQLNRVAVERDARNWRLHERLFYELSVAVLREDRFDTFFSVVREPYLRLYKPWGIEPISDTPIVLSSRGERSYRIVEGRIARTHALLDHALNGLPAEHDERMTA